MDDDDDMGIRAEEEGVYTAGRRAASSAHSSLACVWVIPSARDPNAVEVAKSDVYGIAGGEITARTVRELNRRVVAAAVRRRPGLNPAAVLPSYRWRGAFPPPAWARGCISASIGCGRGGWAP